MNIILEKMMHPHLRTILKIHYCCTLFQYYCCFKREKQNRLARLKTIKIYDCHTVSNLHKINDWSNAKDQSKTISLQ